MMYTSLTSLTSPLLPPLSLLLLPFHSLRTYPTSFLPPRVEPRPGELSARNLRRAKFDSLWRLAALWARPYTVPPYHPDRERGTGRVHQANIPNIPNIPNVKRVHWAERLKASDGQARALG